MFRGPHPAGSPARLTWHVTRLRPTTVQGQVRRLAVAPPMTWPVALSPAAQAGSRGRGCAWCHRRGLKIRRPPLPYPRGTPLCPEHPKLPSQIGRSLTCSNRAMDDGAPANELPDWWPYPVQCGHGHPWSPGHVIVSYLPCPCRADEGISGHTVVHCTTDGCRSAWYRPRHHPPDAGPSPAAGEPGGEPSSPDAGRPRAY